MGWKLHVVLKKTDVTNLHMYQRRILKKTQHLPDRTADEAVFLLAGVLPVEAVIDKLYASTCLVQSSEVIAQRNSSPVGNLPLRIQDQGAGLSK